MKIDITSVLNNDGGRIDFDEMIDLSDLKGVYGESPFTSLVHVSGYVEGLYGATKLIMDTKGVMNFSCDRCSTQYEYPFSYGLRAMVTTDPAAEETEDLIVLEDKFLDLKEQCGSIVLFSMPLKHLCNEDCLGLCSMCGQNLNEGSCDCKEDTRDPRWDALRNFFEEK